MILGQWPQSFQNNIKCHNFPQAGIPGESNRLSEIQKQFSKMDEQRICYNTYNHTAHLRHLPVGSVGMHTPREEPPSTTKDE